MKAKPYLFLLILLALLIFILGVRYGQKVEKTNKTINYLISLPPTQPPSSPFPQEFKTYIHKTCGFSVTYPAWIKLDTETNHSVFFNYSDKKLALIIDCANSDYKTTKDYVRFDWPDSKDKKKLIVITDQKIKPLIEKTLEFIEPTL